MTEAGPASRDAARPRGGIVFVGAVHEAEASLRALIDAGADLAALVTPTEAGASRTSGAVDLAAIAAARGIPVIRTDDLNAPAEVARVRALAPALIVVVGWTRLLGEELLAIPEQGCVGFHASLLPRHRGRAPVNWAILRGETETGNTLMFLSPGADRGDIIDQRAVSITPSDTCATVYEKVAEAGASMLRAHLPALLAGRAPRRKQEEAGASVLPKRTPEMGITEWDRPARQVHDWIRALTHPYPGAFTHLWGRRVWLWSSEAPGPDEGAYATGPPGRCIGVDGEGVRVAVRGGSVNVLRLQDEDGPELDGAAWLASRLRLLRRSPGKSSSSALRPEPIEGIAGSLQFDAVDPALARWARGEGPRPADAPVPSKSSAQVKGGAS